MNATNKDGHAWTGEFERESGVTWYNYHDEQGREYQSKEAPAYRIKMDNTQQTTIRGKLCFVPLLP